MDSKGRRYKTSSQDRAEKMRNKAKTKPPKLPSGIFSTSDSECDTPQPVYNEARRTPKITPRNQHSRLTSPAVRFNAQAETEEECCENCCLPFGFAENLVCSHCSGAFCCKCAKVPEIVASVQFEVPNLRWFCPACDQIISEILRDHREGKLVPRPVASTPKPVFNRSKPNETETALKSLHQRMDGYELILNDMKNMISEGFQKVQKEPSYSQTLSNTQRTANANEGNVRPMTKGVNPYRSLAPKQPAGTSQQTVHQQTVQQQTVQQQTMQAQRQNVQQQTMQQQTLKQQTLQQKNLSTFPDLVQRNKNAKPQRQVGQPGVFQRTKRTLEISPLAANTEISEKEKRKNNVVIHNLLEPSGASEEEMKMYDMDHVQFLIDDAIKADSINVTSAIRLGARRDPGSKPRSLLVTLSDGRDEVINRQISIRGYKGYERIYIDPDRTPNERQFHVALREELKRRRGRGETDLIIRNGQIVHRRETQIEVIIDPKPPVGTTPTSANTSTETIINKATQQIESEDLIQLLDVEQTTSPRQEDTAISDNTLIEIDVPELPEMPRTNEDEEDDDGQGYMTSRSQN